MRALLWLTFLFGCGDKTSPADPVDSDGDGFFEDEDCDDSDAMVFPDAVEVCNGVDDNCDGEADEGLLVQRYPDTDGDGYGDPSATTWVCEDATGVTTDHTDCDDTDSGIHPGADEHCDGVDEDCDAVVDDNPVDPTTWYRDADGDGYGSPDAPLEACKAPAGRVDNALDCDDTDAEVNPETTWYADLDLDGYGDPLVTAQGCEAPEGMIDDDSDCDDTDADTFPGAEEVCDDGSVNDCLASWEEAVATCAWPSELGVGDAVSTIVGASDEPNILLGVLLGDYDGDGQADIVLSSPEHVHAVDNEGSVWMFSTPLAEGATSTAAADLHLQGTQEDQHLGSWLAAPGDLDGDGYSELFVGASGSTSLAGTAWLLAGPTTSLDAALAEVTGSAGDRFGSLADAAGDLDGDGEVDFIFGAPYNDDSVSGGGRVYVVAGPLTGAQAIDGVSLATVTGSQESMFLGGGNSVRGVGDTDGDGLDDLVVGAPYADTASGANGGGTYLFKGPLVGALVPGDADFTAFGYFTGDTAGMVVSAAGDADGDGLADYWMGAPGHDTSASNAGALYLIPGGLSLAGGTNDALAVIHGASSNGNLGGIVVQLDDIDADGFEEIVVGSGWVTSMSGGPTASSGKAEVFVFEAPLSGTVSTSSAELFIEGAQTTFGANLLGGEDLDGNGSQDLLVAEPSFTSGKASGWLLFSPPQP